LKPIKEPVKSQKTSKNIDLNFKKFPVPTPVLDGSVPDV